MKRLLWALALLLSAGLSRGQDQFSAAKPDSAVAKNGGLIVPIGYLTIKDETTALAQETILSFIGAGVSCVDNAGNTATECTIAGGGGGGMADPGGNGIMARTALNVSINRVLSAANTSLTITNGDGVAGNPTFSTTVNTTDDGGAVVKQGASPGTQQTGNFNLNGVGILEKDALATTTAAGLTLQNVTAATGGATRQVSPGLFQCGSAWNTASADTNCGRFYLDVGTAATTTATWKWDGSIAAGGYVNAMSLSNAGVLTTTSSIVSGGALSLSGTTQITFTARSVLKSPADGVFTLFNNGSTDFTRLNFGGTTSSFPALSKESASGLSVKLADNSAYADITTNAQNLITANAAQIQHGSSMEQLTIAAAATTDTSANLLPANAHIDGVVVRVTTVIPTAVTFQVGDATTAGRFCGTSGQFGAVAVAANTTGVCNSHLDPAVVQAAGPNQVAAAKIRITPSATPGAATGVVRITVFWTVFVPPTS